MRVRLQIAPLTAFATELLGETIFGQLCWAIRWRQSESRLKSLLDGYSKGQPFAVVSDAFPTGYLPLPVLPSSYWEQDDASDRKELKSRQWIDVEVAKKLPLAQWQRYALKNSDINHAHRTKTIEIKNSIKRTTGTTGEGQFAPFMAERIWFDAGCHFDVYVVLDDNRFSVEELQSAFEWMGKTGFGADASVGMGKFMVTECARLPDEPESDVWMTLASCSPMDQTFDSEKSFYRIKTHFGRHGDQLATAGNPFKKPIVLAQRGAVFTGNGTATYQFIGRSLNGVSYIQADCVHQGYAPTVALQIPQFNG